MILQLQNHMGFGIRWSWRVSKKNSKLPSWRGLQKNHAQLQHFPRKSLLKFFRRRNFKIIMLTSEWSYPLGEASRKIMLNFNLLKNSHFFWKCHEFGSGQFSKLPSCTAHMSTRQSALPASQQTSQPSQSACQPAKQLTPSKSSKPIKASKPTSKASKYSKPSKDAKPRKISQPISKPSKTSKLSRIVAKREASNQTKKASQENHREGGREEGRKGGIQLGALSS